MSENQSSIDIEENITASTEVRIPRVIRFCIFIIFNIPATLCTLVVLFYVVTDRKVRSSIKNHPLVATLILILIIQVTDVPLYLNFIVHSVVLPRNSSTCKIWWFVDYAVFNGSILLMSWTSFQRHILVYHSQLVATRQGKLLLHYIPLSILFLYIIIFYIYIIYFFPCESFYQYDLPACGSIPCYLLDPILGLVDMLCNNAIPSFLEAFFSLTFVLRFVWHRFHSNLPIQWRKQRKMTLQVMSMSFLNFVTVLPASSLIVAQLCGLSQSVTANPIQTFFFLCYLIPFAFPFICLASMSGMKRKLHDFVFRLRGKVQRFTGTIHPTDGRTNTLM